MFERVTGFDKLLYTDSHHCPIACIVVFQLSCFKSLNTPVEWVCIPVKSVIFHSSCKRTFQTRNKYEMRTESRGWCWQAPHLHISFQYFLCFWPFMSPCRRSWSPNVCVTSGKFSQNVHSFFLTWGQIHMQGAIWAVVNIIQWGLPCPFCVGLDTAETFYWRALRQSKKNYFCKLFNFDTPEFLELLFSSIPDCLLRNVKTY